MIEARAVDEHHGRLPGIEFAAAGRDKGLHSVHG
jgi:hypothetical protein